MAGSQRSVLEPGVYIKIRNIMVQRSRRNQKYDDRDEANVWGCLKGRMDKSFTHEQYIKSCDL